MLKWDHLFWISIKSTWAYFPKWHTISLRGTAAWTFFFPLDVSFSKYRKMWAKQTPGVCCDISLWGILPEACGTSAGRSLSVLSDCHLINSPLNGEDVIRSVPRHLFLSVHLVITETKDKEFNIFCLKKDIWKVPGCTCTLVWKVKKDEISVFSHATHSFQWTSLFLFSF